LPLVGYGMVLCSELTPRHTLGIVRGDKGNGTATHLGMVRPALMGA
jgi:hypothetical protein